MPSLQCSQLDIHYIKNRNLTNLNIKLPNPQAKVVRHIHIGHFKIKTTTHLSSTLTYKVRLYDPSVGFPHPCKLNLIYKPTNEHMFQS